MNQQKLLDEYFYQNRDEFSSCKLYIDDGFSGTDTERDGFRALCADIVSGEIDCVVIKDLSRLSRNYSDAGRIIEDFFAGMGVRFISLSEGVDSFKEPDSVYNILVPITNVINDNYCYQTSKKIRQVLDYKRRSGEFIGAFAPYGYSKDPANRHALVADREAAEVVRDIFHWYTAGMSKNGIVKRLNELGVPNPSEYKRRCGLKYRNPNAGATSLWNSRTVDAILKNRVYVGDMVQGRQRILNYKNHKQTSVPEDEWFIAENTHELLVTREEFDAAARLLSCDIRVNSGENLPHLFAGMLFCADCGRSMVRCGSRSSVYYYCRTYKTRSKTECSRHSVRADELETAVLNALQREFRAGVDYHNIIKQVEKKPGSFDWHRRIKKSVDAKRGEIEKIQYYRQCAYQDWKDGALSCSDYIRMDTNYTNRISDIETHLKNLENDLSACEGKNKNCVSFLKEYAEFGEISNLSRELLLGLVERIEVFEGNSILIKYTFCSTGV